ncbi:hypothetical protein TcCL_NonESM05690 [Trypanosoma cruzi]|nr:hypothetical protein TcCL_NonESM05690 [Trypanosoma cruzi]
MFTNQQQHKPPHATCASPWSIASLPASKTGAVTPSARITTNTPNYKVRNTLRRDHRFPDRAAHFRPPCLPSRTHQACRCNAKKIQKYATDPVAVVGSAAVLRLGRGGWRNKKKRANVPAESRIPRTPNGQRVLEGRLGDASATLTRTIIHGSPIESSGPREAHGAPQWRGEQPSRRKGRVAMVSLPASLFFSFSSCFWWHLTEGERTSCPRALLSVHGQKKRGE